MTKIQSILELEPNKITNSDRAPPSESSLTRLVYPIKADKRVTCSVYNKLIKPMEHDDHSPSLPPWLGYSLDFYLSISDFCSFISGALSPVQIENFPID